MFGDLFFSLNGLVACHGNNKEDGKKKKMKKVVLIFRGCAIEVALV